MELVAPGRAIAVVMTVVLARDVIAPRARIARRLQRLVDGRRDVIEQVRLQVRHFGDVGRDLLRRKTVEQIQGCVQSAVAHGPDFVTTVSFHYTSTTSVPVRSFFCDNKRAFLSWRS